MAVPEPMAEGSNMAVSTTTSFRYFDAEVEEWELYKEQMEQFFVANKINVEMWKAVLINHLCSKTYKLLRDLCTPDQPKSKSYVELCLLLSTHFTPPVVVHKEKRTYFRAKRHEHGYEPVNEWAVRVKNLAANCKFEAHLKHNLVNKFVDGLDGKAFERVCEENEDLTLEKAQELALKYEINATATDINFMKHGSVLKKGNVSSNNPKRDMQSVRGTASEAVKCLACFKPGHYRKDCRFREYVCRKCGRKGYLQAA